MNDEQLKKAIASMADCGCKLDTLIEMCPDIPKEDIVAIWNYIYEVRNKLDDYGDM